VKNTAVDFLPVCFYWTQAVPAMGMDRNPWTPNPFWDGWGGIRSDAYLLSATFRWQILTSLHVIFSSVS